MIAAALGLPVETEPDIAEVWVGHWQGQTAAQLAEHPDVRRYFADPLRRCDAIEPTDEVSARVVAAAERARPALRRPPRLPGLARRPDPPAARPLPRPAAGRLSPPAREPRLDEHRQRRPRPPRCAPDRLAAAPGPIEGRAFARPGPAEQGHSAQVLGIPSAGRACAAGRAEARPYWGDDVRRRARRRGQRVLAPALAGGGAALGGAGRGGAGGGSPPRRCLGRRTRRRVELVHGQALPGAVPLDAGARHAEGEFEDDGVVGQARRRGSSPE